MTKQLFGSYSLTTSCKMLNTNRQTMMKFIKENNLPYVRKFGKQIFFTDEQLKLICQKMNYPYELLMKGGEQDD